LAGLAKLTRLSKSARNCYQQKIAASFGIKGDEGGHIIGAQFGGSVAQINLIPQNWKLNRGKNSPWAAMEREWADSLSKDHKVTVTIDLSYSDNIHKPAALIVTYTIEDGRPVKQPFENMTGG